VSVSVFPRRALPKLREVVTSRRALLSATSYVLTGGGTVFVLFVFPGLAFISSLLLSVSCSRLVFRTISLSFLSVFLFFALFFFFHFLHHPSSYFFGFFWFNQAVVTDTLHEDLPRISARIW
jgi:hypothetical protein